MDLRIMQKDRIKKIPIIDLFAGPGCLGEAFFFKEDKNGKIVFLLY